MVNEYGRLHPNNCECNKNIDILKGVPSIVRPHVSTYYIVYIIMYTNTRQFVFRVRVDILYMCAVAVYLYWPVNC